MTIIERKKKQQPKRLLEQGYELVDIPSRTVRLKKEIATGKIIKKKPSHNPKQATSGTRAGRAVISRLEHEDFWTTLEEQEEFMLWEADILSWYREHPVVMKWGYYEYCFNGNPQYGEDDIQVFEKAGLTLDDLKAIFEINEELRYGISIKIDNLVDWKIMNWSTDIGDDVALYTFKNIQLQLRNLDLFFWLSGGRFPKGSHRMVVRVSRPNMHMYYDDPRHQCSMDAYMTAGEIISKWDNWSDMFFLEPKKPAHKHYQPKEKFFYLRSL